MDFLSRPKKSMFQLQESDLLCKNSCGFYGNPEWHGLCSKCFREYQKIDHGRNEFSAVFRGATDKTSGSHPDRRPPSAGGKEASSPFDRFVSKKKQQSERKTHTMRSIFTGSATVAKAIGNERPKPVRQVSAEVQTVVKEFNEFLITLPKPVAGEIAQRVQTAANKLLKYSAEDCSVEEMSKIANTFYEEFSDRLNRHDLFSVLGEDSVTQIMDYAESYILVRSYKYLFCPPTTDDEDKDLLMQNRVRKLNWVTSSRVGAMIDEVNPDVREAMDAAITDLIEVDTKRTVDAKLKSIVQSCRHVAEMLQRSGNGPTSADQFLPAVIYLVLKANPPRMQSNIKFITRFANPNHLRTGEAGYYFTNLCCAVSFIESMDAKSLEMTEDEFQQYMNGDLASPSSLYEQQAFMSDGLRQMNRGLQILSELRQRQARLIYNIKAERDLMDNFWTSCMDQARDIRAKFPLTIPPLKQLTSILSDSPASTNQPLDTTLADDVNLPLPLMPLPASLTETTSSPTERKPCF